MARPKSGDPGISVTVYLTGPQHRKAARIGQSVSRGLLKALDAYPDDGTSHPFSEPISPPAQPAALPIPTPTRPAKPRQAAKPTPSTPKPAVAAPATPVTPPATPLLACRHHRVLGFGHQPHCKNCRDAQD